MKIHRHVFYLKVIWSNVIPVLLRWCLACILGPLLRSTSEKGIFELWKLFPWGTVSVCTQTGHLRQLPPFLELIRWPTGGSLQMCTLMLGDLFGLSHPRPGLLDPLHRCSSEPSSCSLLLHLKTWYFRLSLVFLGQFCQDWDLSSFLLWSLRLTTHTWRLHSRPEPCPQLEEESQQCVWDCLHVLVLLEFIPSKSVLMT